jgi:glycosyltransferase involved in cell wall biosynthesis
LKNNILIYSPVKETVDLFLGATIEKMYERKSNVLVLCNSNLTLNYTNNSHLYQIVNIKGNNTEPFSLFKDINIIYNNKNIDYRIFNGSATIIMSIIFKIINPLKKNYYIMHGTLKSKGNINNYLFLFLLMFSNLIGVYIIYVNANFKKYILRKSNSKFLGIAGVGVNKTDVMNIISHRKVLTKNIKIFTIAFIGRHELSKGYNLFENIAINNINPSINFISIGGDSINMKENAIKNYGKLNRSDLFKYYDVIDILIMPSISEGLGMSMVECCIAGIPTISSNTDGAKQFITNEFNGLIINSREPNYYIEAINKIIISYDTYSLNCINFSEKNNNFISKPIYFP